MKNCSLASPSLPLAAVFASLLLSSCTETVGERKTNEPAKEKTGIEMKNQQVEKLFKEGNCIVVDNKTPVASDSNPGTLESPLKTINAAARRAEAGTTIIVREGTYRERISPVNTGTKEKPVRYLGATGEKVVVKGSDVWRPAWQPVDPEKKIFKAELDTSLFQDGINPYLIGISIDGGDANIVARPSSEKEMPFTIGQLFADERPLDQMRNQEQLEKASGSWVVSPDGKAILVHLPEGKLLPKDCAFELSARNRIFCPRKRGLAFIEIKGFTFEHCANQGPFPQGGAVSVRSGSNWLIEDNIIRFANTIGLDCGSETWDTRNLKDTDDADKKLMLGGNHVIRNNTITDNGLCGIAGWNHGGTRIIGNILERNNRLLFSTPLAKWEEWAAIKLHCSNALIEGNLIRDNEAFGIWIDNGYSGARIIRNVLHNNRLSGIFLELGAGRCLIAENIISGTRKSGDFYAGFGVYAHDASDVTVAHNLIFNNDGPGVLMRVITDRKFGGNLVQASNEEIFNNLMVNNGGAIQLPFGYDRGKNNKSDFNYYSLPKDKMVFRNPWSLGEPRPEDIAKRMKEVAGKELQPELDAWNKNKDISLPLWRALTGNDVHSVLGESTIKVDFNPKDLKLSIVTAEDLLDMNCSPVAGISSDWTGNKYPKAKIIAGPFQNLKSGRNEFNLWPMESK